MFFKILACILILALAGAGVYFLYQQEEPVCQVCKRPMYQATNFEIELASGEPVKVCCPRCGLYFQQGRDDVAGARVADFDSGQLTVAEEAFYVEGSSVHPCCQMETEQKDQSGIQYQLSWDRCMPSLVGFDSESAAQSFSEKYGGTIKSYAELRAEIVRTEQ
jgi:hypothetical protein